MILHSNIPTTLPSCLCVSPAVQSDYDDGALAFYRDIIGMEIIERGDDESELRYHIWGESAAAM